MMKDTALQILDQTRSVLESYWQGNCEEILTYFAEDSTWIGAQLEQFYQGKVHIAQAIHQIFAEMKPCYLLHQEYRLVHRDKNSCTVMGRYLATTDETAEYFLQGWQRVTFLWVLEDEIPKIRHCHVSNPIGELKVAKGEAFVNTIGKMAYQFLKLHQQATHSKQRIMVLDRSDTMHFISPYEIAYATADRHNTNIVLIHGQEIFARLKITDLLEQAEGRLVAIHRSHLVNPFYVSHLEKQTAVLRSGVRLPIPEKKYTEIRERLQAVFSAPSETSEP